MHDKPRVDFKRFQTIGGIIAPLGHQVVPSDHRTVADVDARHSICISSKPTEKATEIQAVPVAAVDMSTFGTSSTRILGTDQLKQNTFGFGLVSNKELPLGIRPTVNRVTKLSTLADSILPDTGREFFHNDASGSNIDGVLDEFLGGNVHQVGCDFGFVVGHSFQEPSGMFGSFGLDISSGSANTSPTVVEFPSRKCEGLVIGRVGGCEYPLDARVNSNDATFGFDLRKSDFVTEDKIPIFTFLAEFGVLPSINRRNSSISHLGWLTPEAEPFFVGKGEVSLPDDGHNLSSEGYRMPFLLSPLGQKCGSHTSKGRASKLRRKSKILPDCLVVLGMKFQGMDLLGGIDNGGNPVACGKIFGTELVELCRLADLDFDCPNIHNNYLFSGCFEIPSFISRESKIVQQKEKWVRLPRH